MDTAGLPEADGAAAGHPGNLGLGLGLDQGQEPGRREVRSSETAAAEAAGGQAEGLQAEGCNLQDTAYRTAAAVGHLAAEVGTHLEPGTAGTPGRPCQLGVPAVLQGKGPVFGGALLAVGLQMKRKRCCQVFLSAPLVQLVGGLDPGPHSDQKRR